MTYNEYSLSLDCQEVRQELSYAILSKLTLGVETNKKICDEITVIASSCLRNKARSSARRQINNQLTASSLIVDYTAY